MKCRFRRNIVALCVLSTLVVTPSLVLAVGPPATKINGALTELGGLRVLRIWGTPQERGYAYGYLIAEEIVRFVNGFFTGSSLLDVEGFKIRVLGRLGQLTLPQAYEAELRGMMDGIEARLGGPADISAFGRPLRFEDLVGLNSMIDLWQVSCSSLAAWGAMTEDGQTIAGRNLDSPTVPALGSQFVVVHVPAPGGETLGWVSICWPGLIGCLTGMNTEGVSVAGHGSNSPPPSSSAGFTSSGLVYRIAIESAHAATAPEDISGVLSEHHTRTGYNMMITRPRVGGGYGAVVFEHDGDLTKGKGFTLRQPESPNAFLVCTNHSRERYTPDPGDRYPKLYSGLKRIAGSGGKHHFSVKRAWKMLGGVPIDGSVTYHSVVFEPDKKLIHVALSKNGKNAPQCKKVTLDVAKLVAGDLSFPNMPPS